METIEIRLNRKYVIPLISLFSAGVIAGGWHVYFSGKVRYSVIVNIIYAVTAAGWFYTMYFQVRKLWNNTPVLTFSPSGISIHEKGEPLSFLWWQVTHWEVEQDESTHYLIIQTAETKKKVSISWLDRKPEEIELLLHQYKRL
jgi:hypothetical protein